MYAELNMNPKNKRVGDCVIRAISKILNKTWDEVYLDLAVEGYNQADMPSSLAVWATYLKKNGFVQRVLPDACPDCYTIENFCKDHQSGYYLLVTGSHVLAVVDGFYFDTWDSGDEVPVYYFERRKT